MLLPQLLGAQGNRGARRFRLDWLGHYAPRENGPRRELETLGRILRHNFPLRGRRTAGFEDHSRLPYSGGRLLVCRDAQDIQVAGYCGRGYVQLPCDQAPGFAGLDADRYQLATFRRGNLGSGIYLRVFHLTLSVQTVRRLTMCCWFKVILVPPKLDHVSLLIDDSNTFQKPPALGLPASLLNAKGPKRQVSVFSVSQSFFDGLKDFINHGACLLAGKISVLFKLRVHEDTDQVCADHISFRFVPQKCDI